MSTTKYNLEYKISSHGFIDADLNNAHIERVLPAIDVKEASPTIEVTLSHNKLVSYRLSNAGTTTFSILLTSNLNFIWDKMYILIEANGGARTVQFNHIGTEIPITTWKDGDRLTSVPSGKMCIVEISIITNYGGNFFFYCKYDKIGNWT